MKEIGLFPLNVVLFPESALPLHIFEEKYKKLVNNSLTNNEEFGIILDDKHKINDIGCNAKVVDVLKKYNDGRMDVIVHGTGKIKIFEVVEGTSSFKIARYEDFKDENEKTNVAIVDEAVKLYNTISEQVETLNISKLNSKKLNTQTPSYFIAQKAGLTNSQKQALLEMKSENLRLFYIMDHLKKLLPMIKETESIKKIIRNDGYYQFKNM